MIKESDLNYTWIPFYMEMANKLLGFKEDRKSLLDIVYSLDKQFVSYIKADDGGHVSDIDPFTVFGIFNRGLTDTNRLKVCEEFKKKLNIEAQLPSNFNGVPVVNAMKAVFFWRKHEDTAIQPLWNLFDAALADDDSTFRNMFDKVSKQHGIKWNITMGLFWIRPNDFISLDSRNRSYLPTLGIHVFKENEINSEHYLSLLSEVKQKIANREIKEESIPEISYQAWLSSDSLPETTSVMNKNYWFVGYTYGDNKSQLERFFKDDIWESRYNDGNTSDQKLLSIAKTIKKGDIIILKSTSTKGKKHDVPFLRVKGVGIVQSDISTTKEDTFTQCTCSVHYVSTDDKDFEGSNYGAYRKTIHQADSKVQAIIDYAESLLSPESVKSMPKYKKYIDLLKEAHNLVLTGAPGTGKTYMAKEIAKEMGCTEDEEMCFVQFHPSYDYTDFVEGLRPVEKADGQIGFERKDGVFKEFCKKAIIASAAKIEKKPFVFIIDEINRGEASKIFGELFYAIDPGYRGKKDGCVKTQYQNLIPESDVFAKGFYVPENVYILATMNDIDRSVESMDFAMRRRFTWYEVTPEETQQDMLNNLTCADNAIKTMNRLNKAIANIDGLGAAYQVGASYFLKLGENGGNFEKLWEMNIAPLLREYLRGFRQSDKLMDELYNAFFNIPSAESDTEIIEETDED